VAACIAASPASAAREAPDASAWSKSARAATASPDRTAAKSAPWGNGGGAVGLGSGPRAAPRGRGSLAARGISSRVGGREGDGAVTPLLHLGMAQWWTTGVASGSGLLAGRRSAILGGRAQGAVGLTLGLTATAPLETRCFQKYKLHRYFLS
jgi:hypothetical protein